jgi:hypothetical protein
MPVLEDGLSSGGEESYFDSSADQNSRRKVRMLFSFIFCIMYNTNTIYIYIYIYTVVACSIALSLDYPFNYP